MKNKTNLRIALFAVALTGSFIILGSSGTHPTTNCKGSKDICCKKKNSSIDAGGMIWENFSRQFLSITAPIN